MKKPIKDMQMNKESLDKFIGIEQKQPKQRENVNLKDFDEEDWTFKKANTKEFTHAIYNDYPARMIPQIARRLLKLYYPKYDNPQNQKPILDPFGGSGTTCVEALLHNINAIVFDLNPLGFLIQKVRTSIIKPQLLKEKYQEIIALIKLNKIKVFNDYIPKIDNLTYWYNETVVQQLTVIRYAIESVFKEVDLKEPIYNDIKDFFLLCFGKIARDCSYQRKGEHKTYRIKESDLNLFDKNVNVFEAFTETYSEYFQAKLEFFNYYASRSFNANVQYNLENSMYLRGIKENSIDLVITSPPYGDSHTTVAYGQFSRFALEWLLFESKEVRNIDNQLLGGIDKISGYVESNILFNCSKTILREEIIQQIDLLKSIDEIIAENESSIKTNDDFKKNSIKYKEFLKEIDLKVKPLDNISNFEDLIHFQKSIFDFFKSIKKTCEFLLKQLYLNESKKRFKIYDDRLVYVLSFYFDFNKVLLRLHEVLDNQRMCCIVIGNRTVKGIKIPTDEIIVELGNKIGFEHITSYYREIPNKRMPKKNSPTNIKGKKSSTIENESIIILKKKSK